MFYSPFCFTDKNECDKGEGNCDENALCINTEGSYRCQCQSGYFGDGEKCDGNYFHADITTISFSYVKLSFTRVQLWGK